MRSSLRRQLLHLATDLSALAANPDDLGHGFDLLTRSYPTPVADAARAALRSDGDDTWLHQRVRHTHDLWHVVCGCPPTAAGEAAMSAVNVMQLRWPGSACCWGPICCTAAWKVRPPARWMRGRRRPTAWSWAGSAHRC